MKEKGLPLVEQADYYLFTIIIKKNLKNITLSLQNL
jgi:hypothetical protein